jgi:uncharacterized protein YacL
MLKSDGDMRREREAGRRGVEILPEVTTYSPDMLVH